MEFIIEETDGDKRSITLRGEAMPRTEEEYVDFGIEQRGRINYPPSAPVADVALLGAVWTPTSIQGIWDDKFFRGESAPKIVGFKSLGSRVGNSVVAAGDTARSSVELVECFYLLIRTGNELRVSWGPMIRYGVIWNFHPRTKNQQHWQWSIDFEWTGDTNVRPIIKKPSQVNTRSLFQLLLALLDAVRLGVKKLGLVADFYNAKIKAPMDALTNAITGCLEELTKVIANAITPKSVLGDIRANLTRIKLAAQGLLKAFNRFAADFEGPLTQRASNEANVYVLQISKEAYRIAAEMAEREQQLAKLDTPDVQDQAVIAEGQSLRDLALRYYGSVADWIILAQYNTLTANPPVGTVVLIPVKPS